jgi:hypothetical protein
LKQVKRFFVSPGTFFNQLQWSPHHWFILISFLSLAVVETLVGKRQAVYEVYATFLQKNLGLSMNQALWVLLAGKLTILLAGAFIVASIIWVVGNLFGRHGSRRVLFRRLAVVFTVLLGAYTAQHLAALDPWFGILSAALYFWGLFLGYLALREQFSLTHMETAVVGGVALLRGTSARHYSHHLLEAALRSQVTQLAQRPTVGSGTVRHQRF